LISTLGRDIAPDCSERAAADSGTEGTALVTVSLLPLVNKNQQARCKAGRYLLLFPRIPLHNPHLSSLSYPAASYHLTPLLFLSQPSGSNLWLVFATPRQSPPLPVAAVATTTFLLHRSPLPRLAGGASF